MSIRVGSEEAALRGRGKNERTVLVINSLRGEFRLKDLLSYTGMPKATYMYWQKRFNRENPDKNLEEKILEIRKNHKNYGYRRMLGELRNSLARVESTAHTRGKLARLHLIASEDASTRVYLTKR